MGLTRLGGRAQAEQSGGLQWTVTSGSESSVTTGSTPNDWATTLLDRDARDQPPFPLVFPPETGLQSDRAKQQSLAGECMYPFNSTAAWFLKGRYAHLIAATEDKLTRFGVKRREQLQARIRGLKRWGLAQVVVLVLLYLGAIATAVGFLARHVDLPTEVVDSLELMASRTAPLAGALLVVVLIIRRTLSQFEADLLMLVALRGTR